MFYEALEPYQHLIADCAVRPFHNCHARLFQWLVAFPYRGSSWFLS